jgi:hypothetical protein
MISEEESVDCYEVQIVIRVFFITCAGAYGDDLSERVLVVRSDCLKSPVQTHNIYLSRVLVRQLLMIERHRRVVEDGASGLIKFAAHENMSHEAPDRAWQLPASLRVFCY